MDDETSILAWIAFSRAARCLARIGPNVDVSSAIPGDCVTDDCRDAPSVERLPIAMIDSDGLIARRQNGQCVREVPLINAAEND